MTAGAVLVDAAEEVAVDATVLEGAAVAAELGAHVTVTEEGAAVAAEFGEHETVTEAEGAATVVEVEGAARESASVPRSVSE